MKTNCVLLRKSTHHFLLILVLTLFSCSGEDGETGPAGKDGKDGNANVFASDWIPIIWTWKNLETGNAILDIPVDNLESFTKNGGIVLMYYKNGTYSRILPYNFSENDHFDYVFGKFSENQNYQTKAFEGFRVFFDGQPITINIIQSETENYGIRYVLVPASIASTTGVSSNSSVDYEKTMGLLRLNPN